MKPLRVFLVALAVFWLIRSGPTPFYEPAVQADAFLHGHAWVTNAPEHMELSRYALPREALMHPPLAGVAMMPVVAFYHDGYSGADRYQPYVCIVIGALAVAIASSFLPLWLTAFFALGTTFGYEASLGAGWDFVLVLSCVPTLLALRECAGKRRPLLMGLWAGLATAARYDLALAVPFYLFRTTTIKRAIILGLGLIPAAILIAWFNWDRYHSLFDRTLLDWYRYDGGGLHSHPTIPLPFSLRYIPTDLYTVMFLGWNITEHFPWFAPNGAGTALLMLSPAFVLALRAPLNTLETWLLWGAVALVSVPALTVYASGFVQFGPRYYVQVYPFLLTLLARQPFDQITKILVVVSIALVSFGTWEIRTIGFG